MLGGLSDGAGWPTPERACIVEALTVGHYAKKTGAHQGKTCIQWWLTGANPRQLAPEAGSSQHRVDRALLTIRNSWIALGVAFLVTIVSPANALDQALIAAFSPAEVDASMPKRKEVYDELFR